MNGKALTLDYLEQLIQKPLGKGHATKYEYFWDTLKKEHGAKPAGQSYWVLMTTEVEFPQVGNKPYAQQQELIRKYAHYQVPQTLEAATCIVMEQVKEGRRLYPRDPGHSHAVRSRLQGSKTLLGALALLVSTSSATTTSSATASVPFGSSKAIGTFAQRA